MIQRVGSREADHPYCSRVCCTGAVKNALRLKEKHPEADVFILYRDVRTYGTKEKYYRTTSLLKRRAVKNGLSLLSSFMRSTPFSARNVCTK
jgi:heterodisulfide reductase subunit A-like polyferredoxin